MPNILTWNEEDFGDSNDMDERQHKNLDISMKSNVTRKVPNGSFVGSGVRTARASMPEHFEINSFKAMRGREINN
jgi:hypothetical protein